MGSRTHTQGDTRADRRGGHHYRAGPDHFVRGRVLTCTARMRSSRTMSFTHSRLWNGLIAFVGWMLSPATWWNDAFVNIPIAYALASVAAWVWPKTFLAAFVVFYWATNVLGSWMLLVS